MRFEVPEFKRCCFCLPLRYGLLVWSYLLLVPLILFLTGIIIILKFYTERRFVHNWMWVDFIWTIISIIVLLGNIAFCLLLIVAAHKKSLKLLKIYYMCGLVSAFVNFIFAISSFVCDMVSWFHIIEYLVISLVGNLLLEFCFIVMQLYIIGIVRSEILKLENNHSFKFFNNAAEAEMAYYDPDSIQDVDHADTPRKTEHSKEKESEEIKIYI